MLTLHHQRFPDGPPQLDWLTEEDRAVIAISGLEEKNKEDGYDDELSAWGLSMLLSRKIAIGPFCEHKEVIFRMSLARILFESNRRYPKQSSSELYLSIVGDEKNRGVKKVPYSFLILDAAKIIEISEKFSAQ